MSAITNLRLALVYIFFPFQYQCVNMSQFGLSKALVYLPSVRCMGVLYSVLYQIVFLCRNCLSLLQDLPLPPAPLSLVQQLSLNVCTLSSDTLFLRTTRDIEGLPEREDWRVQDEEGSIITSLVSVTGSCSVAVMMGRRRRGEISEGKRLLLF